MLQVEVSQNMQTNLGLQCCLGPSAVLQRRCQHNHQTRRCARLKSCQPERRPQLARRSHCHIRSHTRHSHTLLHRQQHRHICQAVRPPDKGSQASEPSPSQDPNRDRLPISNADQLARQASNATASTSAASASSASSEKKSPWPVRLFAILQGRILTMLAQIKRALQQVPAFVQREKLQRLHKQALDQPGNPDG